MSLLKELIWVGSALRDLKDFPNEVGFSLHQIQEGKMPQNAKHFKGAGSGVLELRCDFDTNTYRVIYAIKLDDTIYVLHSFQKKSNKGIKTPKKEVELIEQRLKLAKKIAKERGVLDGK